MPLHHASVMLPCQSFTHPPPTTRIPHLLNAITTKCASQCPQPPRRHASTHTRPLLPPRPRRASPDPDSPTSRSPKLYLWGIGLFGALTGLYLSYYIASYRASLLHAAQLSLPQNADVSNRWNDSTRDYDEEIEFSEKAMFMGRKRRRLVGGDLVKGSVLEVSCGTGRNFQWYDFEREGEDRITGLVFNDQSAVQLGIAREKWEALQAGRRRSRKEQPFEGKVVGVVGDAGLKGVIRRPEGGFDTIVQTMGVCSMSDPVGFLRQMNYLVRQPGEASSEEGDPGGRILLLEHGRGRYEWINRFLDTSAVMHADRYGCWFNKDIGELVKESGLKIEMVKRYHLGTTWEFVLRPNPELLRREDMPAEAALGSKKNEGKKSKSWWTW